MFCAPFRNGALVSLFIELRYPCGPVQGSSICAGASLEAKGFFTFIFSRELVRCSANACCLCVEKLVGLVMGLVAVEEPSTGLGASWPVSFLCASSTLQRLPMQKKFHKGSFLAIKKTCCVVYWRCCCCFSLFLVFVLCCCCWPCELLFMFFPSSSVLCFSQPPCVVFPSV